MFIEDSKRQRQTGRLEDTEKEQENGLGWQGTFKDLAISDD